MDKELIKMPCSRLYSQYSELVKRAAVYNCMSILYKRKDLMVTLDGEGVHYSFKYEREWITDHRYNLERRCDWELRRTLETNAEVQLADYILMNLHKADLIDEFENLYK